VNTLADSASAGGATPSKISPGKGQGSPGSIKNFNKKLVKHTATISPSPSKKKLLKKDSTMGSNNDLKVV